MFACSVKRGAINKAGVGVVGLDTYDLEGSLLKMIIISGGGECSKISFSLLIKYLTWGTLSLIRRYYYIKACLVVVLE